MEKKLSRQELYELVWTKSMLTLSKEYNISDVGLRKLCARLEVPVPKFGHWQKVQHGKKPNRKPLQVNYTGETEVSLELRAPGSGGTTGFESPLTILHNQILSDPGLSLVVPDRLSAKDKLIAAVKQDLITKQYRPYNGIISSSASNLDITVSPKSLSRALLFMAALLNLLRVRGHSIRVENRETIAIVEGQNIQLKLKEKSSKVVGVESWQDGYTRPTGILSLQMKQSYHLMEAKDGIVRIEDQLAKILAKIELKGREARLENEAWQRQRDEQKAREQIAKERRKREAKELEDFKALIQKAQRWQKTKLLREYINALESSSTPADQLQWAISKCDWYDPMIEKEDSLLHKIDRETLAPIKIPISINW